MRNLARYAAMAIVGILFLEAPALAQESVAPAARMKWEYKVIDVAQVKDDVADKTPAGWGHPLDTFAYNKSKLEAFLSKMGDDGWELVTIRVQPGTVKDLGPLGVTGGGADILEDLLVFKRAK